MTNPTAVSILLFLGQAHARTAVDEISQRKREGNKSYLLSLDRCENRSIAEHAALACAAEYVHREKAMVE